jgi:hypothetical protein
MRTGWMNVIWSGETWSARRICATSFTKGAVILTEGNHPVATQLRVTGAVEGITITGISGDKIRSVECDCSNTEVKVGVPSTVTLLVTPDHAGKVDLAKLMGRACSPRKRGKICRGSRLPNL